MDDFDRLLKHCPTQDLPVGLARRACANFHRRRLRQQRFRLGVCLALVMLGIGLGGPELLSLGAQLQNSGFGVGMSDTLFSGLFDANTALLTYTHSSSSLQAALNNTLGLSAWIGVLALAAGAWVGLSALLTRSLR